MRDSVIGDAMYDAVIVILRSPADPVCQQAARSVNPGQVRHARINLVGDQKQKITAHSDEGVRIETTEHENKRK